MPSRTSKPQYRTVVHALDDLTKAVRLAYGPITDESGSLGDRMGRLQKALNHAEDVAERGAAWLAGKEQRAEKAKQRKAERATSEFV